jgi:hypothetical protein
VVVSLSARLRAEARDVLELVLLPGLAAILPWGPCFRLFRWLCRFDFLYRDLTERAFEQARARGWAGADPAAWRRTRRLITLVDQADFYLARTRSDRWLRKYVDVDGQWPDPATGAALLCSFHWGAGMWALRSLTAHGLHGHALVAEHKREYFPGQSVRYGYYGLRNREVARALRREPIAMTRPRGIMRTLDGGEQIVALVDVAADRVQASVPIPFLDRRALMPRGLLRIAVSKAIPVTVYLNGLRTDNGRRTLEIRNLGVYSDLDALMRDVFSILDAAIRRDPAAWHFWPIASGFFVEEGASL